MQGQKLKDTDLFGDRNPANIRQTTEGAGKSQPFRRTPPAQGNRAEADIAEQADQFGDEPTVGPRQPVAVKHQDEAADQQQRIDYMRRDPGRFEFKEMGMGFAQDYSDDKTGYGQQHEAKVKNFEHVESWMKWRRAVLRIIIIMPLPKLGAKRIARGAVRASFRFRPEASDAREIEPRKPGCRSNVFEENWNYWVPSGFGR
jgi:hypothetical protein